MVHIQQYSQAYSRIRILFRSALAWKILLSLYEKNETATKLRAQFSYNASSITKKIEYLEERRLISRENNDYTLTQSGSILVNAMSEILNSSSLTNIRINNKNHKNQDVIRPKSLLSAFSSYEDFLNSIFRSPLNTQILLLLLDGNKTRNDLKVATGSTSTTLSSKFKELLQYGLIEEINYGFGLTEPGLKFADSIKHLILATATIIKFKDFINSHSFDGIPHHGIRDIHHILEAALIGDSPTQIFQTFDLYLNMIEESFDFRVISTWTNTYIIYTILESLAEGSSVHAIISKDHAQELLRHPDIELNRILEEYPAMKLSVTDEPIGGCLTLTEHCMSLGLNFKDSTQYDSLSILYSESEGCKKWAETVFDEYLRSALPIQNYYPHLVWRMPDPDNIK